MKMLSDSFKSDYDEDPSLDNRARLMMLDAAKYARTILSGDTETEINIDYLLNDEDLVLKLSRVEFQKLIEEHTQQLRTLLEEAVSKFRQLGNTLDQI